jgi:hypothetical protein
MKRLLALLAGAFGLRAAIEIVRRRGRGDVSLASDLRARLDEARGQETEPASAAPPPAAPPPADTLDVDTRRADVHERARRAIDDLNS